MKRKKKSCWNLLIVSRENLNGKLSVLRYSRKMWLEELLRKSRKIGGLTGIHVMMYSVKFWNCNSGLCMDLNYIFFDMVSWNWVWEYKISMDKTLLSLKWKWKLLKCLTLCDPMNYTYSPQNSPGQNTGVGSFPFSRGSAQPRDQTQVSHVAGRFLISWATRETQEGWKFHNW